MEITESYVDDKVASRLKFTIRSLSLVFLLAHLTSATLIVAGMITARSDFPLVDIIFKAYLSITVVISLFWIVVSVGLWYLKRRSRDFAILLIGLTLVLDFLTYWFVGWQIFTVWAYVWLGLSICLYLAIRSETAKQLFGMPPHARRSILLKVGTGFLVIIFVIGVFGSFIYVRAKFYGDRWDQLLRFPRAQKVKLKERSCEGDCSRINFCNFSIDESGPMELYNLVVGEDGCRMGFQSEKSKLVALENNDYISPLAQSLSYTSPYAFERNVRLAKYRPVYLLFKKINMLQDSLHSDLLSFGDWKGFITYIKAKGVEIKLYKGLPWRSVNIFIGSENGFTDELKNWFEMFKLDVPLWKGERYYNEALAMQEKGEPSRAAIYFAQAYYVEKDNPDYAYQYVKSKKDLGIWIFGYEVEAMTQKFPDDERFKKFLPEDLE